MIKRFSVICAEKLYVMEASLILQHNNCQRLVLNKILLEKTNPCTIMIIFNSSNGAEYALIINEQVIIIIIIIITRKCRALNK